MSNHKTINLYRDFLGILSLGVALFIFISLISWAPSIDPSGAIALESGNRGGVIGAYVSGGLAKIFGTGAFLFPILTFLVGWALVRREALSRWGIIISFGIIFLVSLCTLLAIQLSSDPFFGSTVQSGGMVGTRLGEAIVMWMNIQGARVLLGTLVLISVLAMLGVSADSVIEFFRKTMKIFLKSTAKLIGVFTKVSLKSLVTVGKKTGEGIKTFRQYRQKKKMNNPFLNQPKIVTQQLGALENFPTDKKNEKKTKENFKAQENFPFLEELGDYKKPPLSLLDEPSVPKEPEKLRQEIMLNASILEKKLADFGVLGRVVQVLPGPVITLYEFEPAPGIKVSRILSLSDDLALAMRAPSVRFLAPVPGKPVVGIELPNPRRETVYLREILSSETFEENDSPIQLAVGKDNIGNPVVQDLASVPHLLIAGSTGSGKSVGINTMICSILLNATPDEVKLIMVDPKMLELSMYDGIPHLIAPVVTNPKKAAAALQWAVTEMENRYKAMAEMGVRNISAYNKHVQKLIKEEEAENKKKEKEQKLSKKSIKIDELTEEESALEAGLNEEEAQKEIPEKLPYVVIIIDELADLMMVASKGVEESLTRLAQMARASGIHLIVATQRPSVDVLTGIIKANFPARMSFQVTSRVDSRTILDSMGAEKLLGKGDMLFLPPGTSSLRRIHGAMVSDEEINRIIGYIKKQKKPEYKEDVFQRVADEKESAEEEEKEYDEKYDEAVAFVTEVRQASISMVQRKLRVGYNRAARMIEQMERDGVVGPSDGVKPRDVYAKPIMFD
ncbi:MAG: DNA translocase FtsK [Nitrospinales bacterium]